MKNENKNKGIFILMIFASLFISATFGAIFGFLASQNRSEILSLFGSDVSRRDEQKETIRQNIIQEDSAIIEVAKKTKDSVVSIVITKDIPKMRGFNFDNFFNDPFNFFNDSNNQNESAGETQKQTIGGGSGFFVSADGLIVTNRHVVDDSSADYTVITNNEEEYEAEVLAIDPLNDIAVIKIEGDNFPILNLGDSDEMQVGQTVVAIGNSLGEFSNTVSRGIISGLKRDITAGNSNGRFENLSGIIQTDAAINSGNSGGPLLNISGDVIGINVAIAQGAENIGFAIPSNQISKTVEQVKATGKISIPYIGVRYIAVDETLQKANNLPYDYGCLIVRGDKITDLAVVPGSPADKAGLVENDIILEINGEKINEEKGRGLSKVLSQYSVGETVTLKVWHKGEEKEVKVILEERNGS